MGDPASPNTDFRLVSDDYLVNLLRRPNLSPELAAAAQAEMRRRQDAGRAAIRAPNDAPVSAVVVRDFDMPIGSMVVFMLKWAIASIPAIIILTVVGAILIALLAALGFGRP